MEEVEAADKLQLGKWWRFLPSPGTEAIDLSHEQFEELCQHEMKINQRIMDRFKEVGGWESATSKAVGWTPPA